MDQEHYKTLRNAFIGLKGVHNRAKTGDYDFNALNHYADIIEGLSVFKDFEEVKAFIVEDINF